MLGFGLKTHASQVMLLTNYRLDQWLLGAMRGSRELGIYSVAVAWSEALFFLPTAMEQVQRPDLARGTPAQVAWRSSRVFRTCLVLTLMLTLVMWLLAPFLCVTVFGAAFRRSVPQLRILALGCFGISALKLLGDTLTAQRKPLSEMAAISVSFVSIVALDLILIPAHGGIGASLGSTLAYSAGGLAVLAIFVRKLPARLRDLVPRRSDLRWLIERLRPASSR
jgi:O-antigen/teichoic acid export membrane protein